jgi:hypothetical protein
VANNNNEKIFLTIFSPFKLIFSSKSPYCVTPPLTVIKSNLLERFGMAQKKEPETSAKSGFAFL